MAYRIREIRMLRKLTQEELAELSGVSRVTISQLESGDGKNTTSKTLLKLADALDVPVDTLFSAEGA